MEEARANSLRVYFGPGKTEPSELGIFQFMKNKMRLAPENLLAMYKEPKEHCLYIKFKSEEQMKDALLRLPPTMEYAYDKYQSTTVTFSAASSVFKYVRIFNLPPEIEDKEISDILSKYGIIQRMVRERYGSETGFPIWTSVRGVHMEIQKEIPATIHVRNYQARVYYEGLMNKCFVCGSTDHVKASCPKRVNVNDRLNQNPNAPVRYSDVAAGSNRWFPYSKVRQNREEDSTKARGMVVLGKIVEKKSCNASTLDEEKNEVRQNEMAGTSQSEPAASAPQTVSLNAPSVVNVEQRDSEDREIEGRSGIEPKGADGELSDSELSAPNDVEMDDGQDGFKQVSGRKRKPRKSKSPSETSTESDSGSKRGGMPTASISTAQSLMTRGRSKQRKVGTCDAVAATQLASGEA